MLNLRWIGQAFLLLLAFTGCNGGESTAYVTGKVLLDGVPLDRGEVHFVPASGRGAKGEIQSDGTFELGTFSESDGALIGEHKVAVAAFEKPVWPPNYDQPDGSADSGALVPIRYTSADSSGIVREVKPGTNEFTIELTSK